MSLKEGCKGTPPKKEERSLHSKRYIEGKMGTGWVGREWNEIHLDSATV